MNLREALLLKNAEYELKNGVKYTLRRPSAIDLVEVLEMSKSDPTNIGFHLVLKHLVENDKPVFDTVDQIKSCDGAMIQEIFNKIEDLYGEGRD